MDHSDSARFRHARDLSAVAADVRQAAGRVAVDIRALNSVRKMMKLTQVRYKMWEPARTFVPVLLCLVCTLGCGNSVLAVENLKQGSTVVVRCPLRVSPQASDTFIQIIKTHLTLEYPSIRKTSSSSGPFVISNNTDLDPLLLNETSRYSVTEETGRYTLTISNAQPEDSGTWICKQFSGQDLQGSTDARDFIVVGPLKGVYWRMVNGSKVYNPTETPNNNVVVQGAVVTLDHTNRKSGRSGKVRDLFCDVLFTNVAPQINITISSVNKEHVREITDRFGFTPFTRTSLYNGGLIFNEERWRYKPTSSLVFGPSYHGWELHCRASLSSTSTVIDKHVILNILYAPRDISCGYLKIMRFPRGTKDAEITCKAHGNPAPVVSWQLPDSTVVNASRSSEGYNISTMTKADGVHVTTTLTIADVDLKDYGTFSVLANNKFGSGEYKITVLEGAVNSGADPRTPIQWMVYPVLLIVGTVTRPH